MPEFINVPVPSHLVTDVMQFIAERSTGAVQAAPTTPTPPTKAPGGGSQDGAESWDWTREQFETLYASDASSVKMFAQVLTILADASPAPMTVDELGQHFGFEGITLQRTFCAVSRWMRKRMGGDIRWPIHFPEGGWALNEHNSTLWKQITA